MSRLSEELEGKVEELINEYCEENEVEVNHSPKNLRDRNFYGRFDYLQMDNEIYVSMTKDTFRSFEYYLGMEYEQDHINSKFEFGNTVVAFYEDCDRLISILDLDEERFE